MVKEIVEVGEPIKENIEFRIAKRTIPCYLIAYTHPHHQDEIVLEWRIEDWKPSLTRIEKSKIPALIKRLKELEKE